MGQQQNLRAKLREYSHPIRRKRRMKFRFLRGRVQGFPSPTARVWTLKPDRVANHAITKAMTDSSTESPAPSLRAACTRAALFSFLTPKNGKPRFFASAVTRSAPYDGKSAPVICGAPSAFARTKPFAHPPPSVQEPLHRLRPSIPRQRNTDRAGRICAIPHRCQHMGLPHLA